jgi:hypothetical protein
VGAGAGAGEGSRSPKIVVDGAGRVSLVVVDVNHTQVEQLRTVPPDDSENE